MCRPLSIHRAIQYLVRAPSTRTSRATERPDTLTRRTLVFFNPVGIRTWCRYGQADRQFHEYPRSGNVCEVRGVTVRPTTRAIPLLRHDMKFPLYRLATLWQSALTIRGNVLADRHDAERATCLKRSRHGREEKRVRERISSMESHTHAPASVTCGPVGSRTRADGPMSDNRSMILRFPVALCCRSPVSRVLPSRPALC